MPSVWFFMGLLDVLITEVWRKTAWLRLQMSTAVQYSKHTETPAPCPTGSPGPPLPRLQCFETTGGLKWGGGWGRRKGSWDKGLPIHLVRMKTQFQLQITNKDCFRDKEVSAISERNVTLSVTEKRGERPGLPGTGGRAPRGEPSSHRPCALPSQGRGAGVHGLWV